MQSQCQRRQVVAECKNLPREELEHGFQYKSPRLLFRRLHLQRIIEAIEIIKQPNRRQQFHDLAFIKMLAQLGPKLVVHGVRVAGHPFCQP